MENMGSLVLERTMTSSARFLSRYNTSLITQSLTIKFGSRIRCEWLGRSANCSYCEKPSAPGKVLEVCFDCSNVMYCNRACQVSHWQNGHRENCEPTAHQMRTEPQSMTAGETFTDAIDGRERVFLDYRTFEAMDLSTLELAIEEYRTLSKKGRHIKKNSTDAKACWLAAELTVPLVLMYMLHNQWGLADRFIKEFYCKVEIKGLVKQGSEGALILTFSACMATSS